MKLLKFALCALSSMVLVGCTPSQSDDVGDDNNDSILTTTRYQNPIIMADCPDPTVVRDGNTFYIFGTGGRVYKNEDLNNGYWEQLDDIKRTVKWGNTYDAIWAPDVVKIGDKWNYYYSVSVWGDEDPGIGVMQSDSLEGPWEDKGKIFLSSEIGVDNSIDPVVLEDNGKVWMAWGSFRGIFIVELNEDGTALKNPETAKDDKILIAGIVGPWNGGTYEGAYIRKINDYYYLFGSQGTCCEGVNSTYHVKVARSKSITGPYVDAEGVDMLGTDRGELVVKGDQNVAGPGHMSLFQDDANDWWMVYHGYDKLAPAGRYVFMDKLEWDDNGFPHLVSYAPSYFRTVAGPKIKYEK